MKSYLRVIILLFVVSFLILNCKKDEYKEINNLVLSDADIPPGHGHKFSIQDLLDNDETFIRLSNKFLKEDFPNKGSFLKNAQGDSLIITSDTINVVEKEDYKSYTIRVKRKGKNFDTENIVIENKKGKENAFIIGYKFDYDWIEEKVNGIVTAPRGRIFFNNYNSSFLKTETCYTMTFTVTIPCGCGHTNPYVCNGCDTGEEYPDSYEYTGSYCVSGSDNETGAPFTTDSGTGGGGGVGGGSPSPPSDSNDTSQTEMNLEDMTEFVETKLNRLISKLELEKNDADWASENIKQALAIHDFCSFSRWNSTNINLAKDFFNITNEIPTAKFERYLELIDLIEEDPFSLLEDCAQENGLSTANYQQLYDHTLPTACINRLDALGNDFQDQPLNTGNAAVANVDYYGVEITQNPDFNLDGNPDTDAEVFDAYRENFTSWASGSKDDFQFSCNIPLNNDNRADVSWDFYPYFSSDAAIWNSSSPVTAIIRIDADADLPLGLGGLLSDDGAIMISAFTSQYWIGSTIQTLATDTQPFSGNRQWGFLTNQNGNLELFTRAVDVARISAIVSLDRFSGEKCKADTYYNIGEATWSNLQEQIKQWVNVNGGQATLVNKTAVRLDKTKLKQALESNQTINQINCN